MSLPLIVVALDQRQSVAVYHESSKPQMRASSSKVLLWWVSDLVQCSFLAPYMSCIRTYFKSLAEDPTNCISNRHLYSSLALSM